MSICEMYRYIYQLQTKYMYPTKPTCIKNKIYTEKKFKI